MYQRERNGFTLIEVLVALAITAISLVALLRLLVVNINTMDSASYLSRASLIGNEKIAEIVSDGNLENGTQSGLIQYDDNNTVFNWQVNVTEEQPEGIKTINLHGLKKVNVRVVWKQGRSERQVSMSTYICPDKEIKDVLMADNNR